MAVRFLALLLAVVMMTGAAAQVSAASADAGPVATALDNAPDLLDLDPAVVPEVVVVAVPRVAARVQLAPAAPPRSGRMHAVLVFRPPR